MLCVFGAHRLLCTLMRHQPFFIMRGGRERSESSRRFQRRGPNNEHPYISLPASPGPFGPNGPKFSTYVESLLDWRWDFPLLPHLRSRSNGWASLDSLDPLSDFLATPDPGPTSTAARRGRLKWARLRERLVQGV